MSVGLLGKGSPLQNQNLTLYTAPYATYTTLDITCVNMGYGPANINIAITDNPTNILMKDYIEYKLNLIAGGNFNVAAMTLSPTESIIVYSDADGCVFRISGVEKN